MKKAFSIIFALCLMLTLSACDVDDVSEKNPPVSSMQSASDVDTQSNVSQAAADITREGAIEIALNHAGLSQNDVINLTAEYDRDLSGNEWEVEFDKDGYEYSYEINAKTGDIIKSEKEID